MARHPEPKKWYPTHPEKYVGDVNNIIARSSWEVKFLNWCDSNPNILKYSSEEIIIHYYSQVDQKMRRYFVDFAIMVKTKTGEIKKYIVEVKPDYQTRPPEGKRKTKRLYEETATYVVNTDKWAAATEWAKKCGMEFIILTEKDLFPNGNTKK